MAENDVTIQIKVEAKDAQAAIELFGKESARVINESEKSIESFKGGIADIAKKLAGPILAFATFKKAIDEAVVEENAIRQLNLAIAGTGEYSKEASKSLIDFAGSLGEITALGDGAIIQGVALAKSFGITNDKAKELVTAATNLSAVTGDDLTTSIKLLGGTFDGTVGKLANLGPEFRNLTAEAAKNGDAIKLVNERYGEAGAALGDTFSGQLKRLESSFGDTFKAIGQQIIGDQTIQNGLKNLAEGLKIIAPILAELTKAALVLFNTIIKGLGVVVTGLSLLGEQFAESIGADKLQASFQSLTSTTVSFVDVMDQAGKEVNKTDGASSKFEETLTKVSGAAQKTVGDIGKIREEAQKFKDSVFSDFGTEAEKESIKSQNALKKLAEFEKQSAFSFEEAKQIRIKIEEDYTSKIEEINKKSLDKQVKDAEDAALKARQNIEKAASDPITFAFQKETPFTKEEVAASVVGGLNMALKGKAGAVDLVSKTLGGVADTIIPGIGGAVAGLAQLLSQGPDATKQFIKDFINSIPDIIQAISESIPVVVEALVDTLVNKGGALRIGIAIAKAMAGQPLWAKLSEEIFGKSGEELGKAVTDGVTEYSKSSQDAFTQFFTEIGPTFGRAFEGLGRELENSFEGFDDKFNSAINDFSVSFSGALNDWINAIGPAFSRLFNEIGPALEQAFGGIITGIVYGISNVFMPIESALLGLADMIRQFADSIAPSSIGGSGGGKGLLRETLGFSKGGIVYAAQGTLAKGTDTVPAMLTPGELVVPRDMVSELGAYLSSQRDTSGGSNTAMLAAILSEVQKPIVVQAEAKVNQSAFADIILQLNRQNARLTA
jgi:class 3 adenylate cyclase